MISLKADRSPSVAKGTFDAYVRAGAFQAAMLIAQTGMRELHSWGAAEPLDECRKAAVEILTSVHRVVSTCRGSNGEATLYSYSEEQDSRVAYARIPRSYARAMWTADRDEAVVIYGESSLLAAANALANAILTIADAPPPVAATAFYTVTSATEGGEMSIKAYAEEANARAAYLRAGREASLVLAAHPGNRSVEAAEGGQDPRVLSACVAKAGKAAASVPWVAVCRVRERIEASLRACDTAREEAAMAAYARMQRGKARGVWGGDHKAALKSDGRKTDLERCEALAADILRWA